MLTLNVQHTNMKVLLFLASALPFIACQVMTGGQHPYKTDITDPNVVFAVNGINELFKTNGDSRPRMAEKVISATSQVVSGVMYRFKIEVSGGDSKELCTVAVWSRPWLTGADQIRIEGTPQCAPELAAAPEVGNLLGGEETASLSEHDVQNAVKFLESQINAKTNSLFYLKVTGASKVTKQVVNGIIYRFYDLTYAQSTCTQNDVKLDTNKLCAVSTNALPTAKCTSEVYWNPRETVPYTLRSEVCSE